MIAENDFNRLLSRIPHLKLRADLPIKPMLKEILLNIDSYSEIQLNERLAGDVAQQFKDSWAARGLIDYTSDSRKILTYQKIVSIFGSPPVEYFKTDLYSSLPETISLVKWLTHKPQITRIFSIKAGMALPWHNHYLQSSNEKDYKTLVFQVPLLNSHRCLYEVRDRYSNQIHSHIYKPGEIWLFNSFHDHRVINQSELDRLSLFIETPLESLNQKDLLREAVDAYLSQSGSLLNTGH